MVKQETLHLLVLRPFSAAAVYHEASVTLVQPPLLFSSAFAVASVTAVTQFDLIDVPAALVVSAACCSLSFARNFSATLKIPESRHSCVSVLLHRSIISCPPRTVGLLLAVKASR